MNTSQPFREELLGLIKARYPLIAVETFEEGRFVKILHEINQSRQCPIYEWSRTDGIKLGSKEIQKNADPLGVLNWYQGMDQKSLLVLKDYHPFLKDPLLVRKLRDLVTQLKITQKNIIFVSCDFKIPLELTKEIATLNLPLPQDSEISALIQSATSVMGQTPNPFQMNDSVERSLIDAAKGLTFDEIENVFAKSMVSKQNLDPLLVQSEKKEIVKKSQVLEFINPKFKSIDEIGGLDNLKLWLKNRRQGLSDKAKSLGLPAPKGVLLVGVPGCGKSAAATACAVDWQLPLLRLDLGRVYSGLVGSSEANIRLALQTAEGVAPCVLWIDEIEKGLSGSQGGGGDSGTSTRVFGTVLTWMQEKTTPVFVMATANDISGLPPELLRKGRFDEIFYVDLPTFSERKQIFELQMQKYKWEVQGLQLEELAELSTSFSGAEIEQVVVGAQYLAFGSGEPLMQKHLKASISQTVPLAFTMAEKIENLRQWAQSRARPASSTVIEPLNTPQDFLGRGSHLEWQ